MASIQLALHRAAISLREKSLREKCAIALVWTGLVVTLIWNVFLVYKAVAFVGRII